MFGSARLATPDSRNKLWIFVGLCVVSAFALAAHFHSFTEQTLPPLAGHQHIAATDSAAVTPAIKLAVETMPPLAPGTAARNQQAR